MLSDELRTEKIKDIIKKTEPQRRELTDQILEEIEKNNLNEHETHHLIQEFTLQLIGDLGDREKGLCGHTIMSAAQSGIDVYKVQMASTMASTNRVTNHNTDCNDYIQ